MHVIYLLMGPDLATSVLPPYFAILHWFGRRFEPRFTDLQRELKELYCADTPASYEKCLIQRGQSPPTGRAL